MIHERILSELKPISPSLSVSGQVFPSAMASLADAGFRMVICNRPDGEVAGQPTAEEMAQAAEEAGLEFRYIPIVPGEFTRGAAEAFATARREARGKVLAYCRSGARSTTLDAIANAEGRSVEERIAAAAAAGYDLSDKRALLG